MPTSRVTRTFEMLELLPRKFWWRSRWRDDENRPIKTESKLGYIYLDMFIVTIAVFDVFRRSVKMLFCSLFEVISENKHIAYSSLSIIARSVQRWNRHPGHFCFLNSA